VKYPVTVKIRLQEDVDYTCKLIDKLVNQGIQGIAVHGNLNLLFSNCISFLILVSKNFLDITISHILIFSTARYYWQKGDKRGLADWEALKVHTFEFFLLVNNNFSQKIRATFPDLYLIGNGNIGEFSDFDKMVQETGVNAAVKFFFFFASFFFFFLIFLQMAGYGALVSPSIFSEKILPTEKILHDYVNIARTHKNEWIDILRHTEWILKNYAISPLQKSNMFTTRSWGDYKYGKFRENFFLKFFFFFNDEKKIFGECES
jgi:tRNA-dihydrouridine synthase